MKSYFTAIDPSKPSLSSEEIFVVKDYLHEDICKKLVVYSDWSTDKGAASIGQTNNEGFAKKSTSEGFKADRIEILSIPIMRNNCMSICADVYRNHVGPHYGVEIEWFEFPHILRYGPGGTYGIHSDAYNYNREKNEWRKVLNRDYSSILYLNSDFSGGTLAFPKLNLRIKPQAGMLITFPSDNRFLHTAEPTLTGTRYALVTWAAIRGGKRVANAPRAKNIVRMS